MPNLKHLIDDLRELRVNPDEVKLPGTLYDDLVDQAEDIIDEDPDDE